MKGLNIVLIILLPTIALMGQMKWTQEHFNAKFYNNQFTGFTLYDPSSKQILEDFNGEKLFTPASNVKILSLYSALKVLPDSIPALKYERKGGDLYIQGTGDPTFLHPKFKKYNKILDILKEEEGKIYLHWGTFNDTRLGLGWSWEDYETYFSPERSELPMYGNMVTIKRGKTKPSAFPLTFSDSVKYEESLFYRHYYDNTYYLGSRNGKATSVPFVSTKELIAKILSEATGKEITLTNEPLSNKAKTMFSLPSDLVYERMMKASDNFLAEQLLLMVSGQVSGTLNTKKAVDYIQSKYLKEMPQKPVWVDGSGLSRYNLFSPQDFVYVLDKLYQEIPHERLFSLFAVGGVSGTLRRSYGGSPPYVYAKSGTLSNNYCLSGYVKTKSGKTLIFSIMNNHFTHENWQVRQQTEKLLQYIRDNY